MRPRSSTAPKFCLAASAVVLAVSSSAAAADAAPGPKAWTKDRNANGRVDVVEVKLGHARGAAGIVVRGRKVRGVRVFGRTATIRINEGRRPDTGARPTVRIAGRWVRAADRAAAVLVDAAGVSARAVDVRWSEPVAAVGGRWSAAGDRGAPATLRPGRAGQRRARALRLWGAVGTARTVRFRPAGRPNTDAAGNPARAGKLAITQAVVAVPAAPASAFVDSVGVNVHMSYTDTAYRQSSLVLQRLQEAGIRHVRDGLGTTNRDQISKLRVLGQAGIRLNVLLGDPHERFGTGSLEQQKAVVINDLLPFVDSVEGANEWDLSGSAAWPSELREHQRRLFELFKGDARTAALPVLGPALGNMGNAGTIGDLTPWMDLNNFHPYAGGKPQSEPLGRNLIASKKVSPSRAIVATEAGYHDATAATIGQPGVYEDAASVYVSEMFLAAYAAGVRRTYAYELLDQRPDPAMVEPERRFGLLRTDGSPKPAFTTLTRMMRVLSASGPAGAGTIAYRLEGPRSAQVRSIAVRRGDGAFVVALWTEDAAYDIAARRSLPPTATPLVLRMGTPATQVSVHAPAESDAPVQAMANTDSIPVTVGRGPTLVEIRLP